MKFFFIFLMSFLLIPTAIALEMGECDFPYSYDSGNDLCISDPIEDYICPDGFELIQPDDLESCNQNGGIWDECPQCPQGYICPQNICEPMCIGVQICVDQRIELRQMWCYDPDEIYDDGTCVMDGEPVDSIVWTDFWGQERERCPENTELVSGDCVPSISIQICNETQPYSYKYDGCTVDPVLSETCLFDGELNNDLCFIQPTSYREVDSGYNNESGYLTGDSFLYVIFACCLLFLLVISARGIWKRK